MPIVRLIVNLFVSLVRNDQTARTSIRILYRQMLPNSYLQAGLVCHICNTFVIGICNISRSYDKTYIRRLSFKEYGLCVGWRAANQTAACATCRYNATDAGPRMPNQTISTSGGPNYVLLTMGIPVRTSNATYLTYLRVGGIAITGALFRASLA